MTEWLSRAWRALKRRLNLVEDCRAEWRKISTWLTAAALAVYGAFLASPDLAVQAWHLLPEDLRSAFPYQDKLALLLFGAIFVAKFIKQRGRE